MILFYKFKNAVNGNNLCYPKNKRPKDQGAFSRRLFTIGAIVDGELIAEARAYNKKDASQVAAQIAVEKLGLV